MTKTISTVIVLIILIGGIVAIINQKKHDVVSDETIDQTSLTPYQLAVTDGTYISADKTVNESGLLWDAAKVGGKHTGFVDVKNAALTVVQSTVTGGTIDVDMTSISNSDVTDIDQNTKLVDHLKSTEFFDVEKYPVATLAIQGLYTDSKGAVFVKGDLTLRGVTLPTIIPVTINSEPEITVPGVDDAFMVTGALHINRRDYGILINPALDKVVDNKFTVNFELLFVK